MAGLIFLKFHIVLHFSTESAPALMNSSSGKQYQDLQKMAVQYKQGQYLVQDNLNIPSFCCYLISKFCGILFLYSTINKWWVCYFYNLHMVLCGKVSGITLKVKRLYVINSFPIVNLEIYEGIKQQKKLLGKDNYFVLFRQNNLSN